MLVAFDELEILKQAEEIADLVWTIVEKWSEFSRDTVGKQLVRAADSIGANIAEMYGRFNYGEKTQFLYYARGSLFETKYWINRASKRGLTEKEVAEELIKRLTDQAKKLNNFIASVKQAKKDVTYAKTLKEAAEPYAISHDQPFIDEAAIHWLESHD